MINNKNRLANQRFSSIFQCQIIVLLAIFSGTLLLLGTTHQVLAEEKEWIYTIAPGDNLWNINKTYLKGMNNLSRLQQLNQIQRPQRLPPGMQLRIPVAWLKVTPAVVVVQHLQGTVHLDRADGSQQLLTLDTTLHVGDTVRSEAHSMTTLQLADGSIILLQENSQLTFDTLSIYGKTGMVDSRLRLKDGRIESDVKPVKPPSGRFEILTPAALSSVRGTRFRTTMHDTEQVSRTEVSHGNIIVSVDEASVVVDKGFGTVINVGEPPAPPRPLLAAPSLIGLATVITKKTPRFTLTPLDGAHAYRAFITPADKPNAPIFDRLFPDFNLQGPILDDGDYLLQVRGVDSEGLEGLDGTHPFSIDIIPEPPASTTPAPGAARYHHEINFQWQASPYATHYHFKLATDETFSNLLINVDNIKTTHLQPEQALPPGQYYWQIAGINATGKAGIFSTPQALTVLNAIAAPQMLTATVTRKEQIEVSWDAIEMAIVYELQIAYDPLFENRWRTINTNRTNVQFEPPPEASYHLRVRVVDAAGHSGPYSDPYHVIAETPPFWLFSVGFLLLSLLIVL
ncbi:MAG: FecR domain-containing protein [Gammaproteobacteria bacterium]|nr:FecR domain-containing protein [Gammaproteobacteria bacterium]